MINREQITFKQTFSLMVMFIIGSAIVLGSGNEAKQDVWLAIIIALVMALPAIFTYSTLLKKFPEKNLFDILEKVFGKTIGKIMILIFIWYTFHLGSLVIRNFSEFIQVVSIPETPQFALVLFMGFICIWIVKAGIEVLGRWASFILPFLILIIFSLIILSIPKMNFINVTPFLDEGIKPVLTSSFSMFSFPFAETVVFMAVLGNLNKKEKPFKVYFWSLIVGAFIIVSASLRNLLVLGVETISMLYFPSYSVVSIINIGNFLQRVEVLISTSFLFGGIVKTSICLYATAKGLAKVLNIDDYRSLVVPIGLLMMNFSMIIYGSTMEMFDWAFKVYKYYAIPFQIVIPVLTLIVALIRFRKSKGNGIY